MLRKIEKSRRARPPRIRVPNQQKAIFTVDNQKTVGVVQRLSLTGGSALLNKGPIPEGTLGELLFATVFGKVSAHIEFLHWGADGVPLAQAFTFITMGATSSQRLQKALKEMNTSDFSDTTIEESSLNAGLEKLRRSIRHLSGMLNSKRSTRS
jgi:hypothetical protein